MSARAKQSRPNPHAPLANPMSQKPVALDARKRFGSPFPTRPATTTLLWTGATSSRCRPRSASGPPATRRSSSLPTTSKAAGLSGSRSLRRSPISPARRRATAGPDYDLAARILLSLIKLSSVNRQRVDLTAQIAMTTGPDLSGLSDAELRAIELAADEKLNELALRIAGSIPQSGAREP